MSTEIETPEAMATRLRDANASGAFLGSLALLVVGIRADREQIAAKCGEMAAEAMRETEDLEDEPRAYSRCEGQASAFEAVATMLRGAK